MNWIGWRVAELWPFEMFQNVWMGPEVGRRSYTLVVNIHTSYTDVIYSSFAMFGT